MTVSRPCFVMCVRTRTENMWRTRRGSIEIETNALALPQNSSTFMFRSFVCDVCLPATPCCTKVTLMVQCNTFTQSLFCSPLKMEWRTSPNGEHCALNGIRMCCCGFDFYNNILDRPQSADNSFSVIFFFCLFLLLSMVRLGARMRPTRQFFFSGCSQFAHIHQIGYKFYWTFSCRWWCSYLSRRSFSHRYIGRRHCHRRRRRLSFFLSPKLLSPA